MQAWHAGQSKDLGDVVDVEEAVGGFRRAAVLAEWAGFDGVEVLAQG